MSRCSLAFARYAETHRRLTVEVGEDEAPRVKMKLTQRRRRSAVATPKIGARAEDRVALRFIHVPATCLESPSDRRAE
jgi:hypothetical protein